MRSVSRGLAMAFPISASLSHGMSRCCLRCHHAKSDFASPPDLIVIRRFNSAVTTDSLFTLLQLASLIALVLRGTGSAQAEGTGRAIQAENKSVRVATRQEGELTHFLARNDELCEVTMTFEMAMSNLKGSVDFPCTVTLPPGEEVETFTLAPIEPGAKWEYSYTNFYKLGSQCAKHDETYVYQLPYAPGNEFKVTQSFNGTFSHKGSNKYAVDWKMPEGTPVRAARGGTVVKVKDGSDKGGSSLKYDPFNNYVLIRHDDATLGQYCHLHKNGALVKPGQVVKPGDLIALSGNTGFSSGPHLHFCVFKTRNGRERESIPIRFRTTDDWSALLLTGHRYKAPVQNASLSAAAQAGGQGAAVQ